MLFTIQKTIAGFTLHSPRDGRSYTPEPVTLHVQLPIRLWIMETTFYKLVRALRPPQDGMEPLVRSSGIFHLQKQVASLVFSP